jgi:hypothetical protein
MWRDKGENKMATKTTYSCDKCRAEFSDRKTLKCITVQVGNYAAEGGLYSRNADWCLPCLQEFGIVPKSERKPTTVPAPSLEDMIRQIVREEMP